MKWLKENYKIVLLVGGEITSFLWTAVSGVLDLTDITGQTVRAEYITLIGLFIFAFLVYSHIFSLYKRLSPKIDMVFGDFPACRHNFLTKGGQSTLYRVGLVNYGGKTIENIRVSLEQIEPQGITFGPIRLQFMHQRQPDEVLQLHPGKEPSLFVDVIQDVRISEPPGRVFTLPYTISGVPNILQAGNYRLTLLAEGQDVQSVRKHFLVSWTGEQIEIAME